MTMQRFANEMTGSTSAFSAEAFGTSASSEEFSALLLLGAVLAASIFLASSITIAGIGALVLLVHGLRRTVGPKVLKLLS